jgi:hypothetical protein
LTESFAGTESFRSLMVDLPTRVDLDFRRCFQVMEAASEAVVNEWTRN